jgi:hypothetical protein
VVGLVLGGILPDWLRSASPVAVGIQHALSPWLVVGAEARAYQLALLATGVLAVPSIIPVLLLREPEHAAAPATDSTNGWRWRARLRRDDLDRVWRLARGPVGKFATTQSIVGFGAGLFGPYLNIYFVKQLGASTTYYGSLTAALAILMAAASLLIVPFARRVGEVRAAVAVQAISLPCLVALGVVPVLWFASAVYLVRGPLMNAANAPLQTVLMGAVRHDERVVASGVYNVSWQVAGALGSGLGGTLIYVAGFPATFGTAAALYGCSVLLLAWWFGGWRGAVVRKPAARVENRDR